MNILYINHYAGSIYHGMEYRPYYLAREWVKLGHTVTIVASNFSHIRQKNIVIAKGQNYLEEQIDGINYIWCRTSEYNKNGIKRVINIFQFLAKVKKLIPQLITKNKPDLVIASSTYPFDTKVAYRIAKLANAKFIYEVHDLWPLTPIEVGGMSKWHPYIIAMQLAENFGYKYADKVISLLPKANDYMQQHGMAPDKFVYIPNGIAVDDWQNNCAQLPNEHTKLINNLRNENKFIIGYTGGMGEANALDYLLDSAKNLPDNITIVLIGNGSNKAQLIKRIKIENINNCYILPSINKLQIPNFLTKLDALYIGWNNLAIYRFGICPNKLFDYMLASKPIIHSVTAGNDLVEEANGGISVAAEDVPAISEAIIKLSQLSKEDLKLLGQNGHDFVKIRHNYQVLAQDFLAKVM